MLTSRQREILQLVAEGKSTKEVAQMLDLSVKTVETHRAQIMDRLGIRDLAGLVALRRPHGPGLRSQPIVQALVLPAGSDLVEPLRSATVFVPPVHR